MLLVLARVNPGLVRNTAALARATFHPAYLVKNGVEGCSGAQLVAPVIDEGPTAPLLPIALDSDGEEVDEEPTADAMLPPKKYTLENYKSNAQRGRPRNRRYRSRGSLSSDGGAPAPHPRPAANRPAATSDADVARDFLSQISVDDL